MKCLLLLLMKFQKEPLVFHSTRGFLNACFYIAIRKKQNTLFLSARATHFFERKVRRKFKPKVTSGILEEKRNLCSADLSMRDIFQKL